MTVNKVSLERLRSAVGPSGVSGSVVTPSDRAAAVSAVQVCAETRTPLTVAAGASSNGPAPSEGIVLNLEKLRGVELHASGLTLRAEAGASVDAVREAAAAAKLSVVGAGTGPLPRSVGAVIARGAVARRSLTGVDAVLTTGETITFGGAALKDVVGYDVPALLLGSLGRLAVILAVTFRLEPAGARTVAGPAPGVVAVDPSLCRAFDPTGLLQSHR